MTRRTMAPPVGIVALSELMKDLPHFRVRAYDLMIYYALSLTPVCFPSVLPQRVPN